MLAVRRIQRPTYVQDIHYSDYGSLKYLVVYFCTATYTVTRALYKLQ